MTAQRSCPARWFHWSSRAAARCWAMTTCARSRVRLKPSASVSAIALALARAGALEDRHLRQCSVEGLALEQAPLLGGDGGRPPAARGGGAADGSRGGARREPPRSTAGRSGHRTPGPGARAPRARRQASRCLVGAAVGAADRLPSTPSARPTPVPTRVPAMSSRKARSPDVEEPSRTSGATLSSQVHLRGPAGLQTSAGRRAPTSCPPRPGATGSAATPASGREGVGRGPGAQPGEPAPTVGAVGAVGGGGRARWRAEARRAGLAQVAPGARRSTTQNVQPRGGVGQLGSGIQSSPGAHDDDGTGHPGGALKRTDMSTPLTRASTGPTLTSAPQSHGTTQKRSKSPKWSKRSDASGARPLSGTVRGRLGVDPDGHRHRRRPRWRHDDEHALPGPPHRPFERPHRSPAYAVTPPRAQASRSASAATIDLRADSPLATSAPASHGHA